MAAVETDTIDACALRANRGIRRIGVGPPAAYDGLGITLLGQHGLEAQRWSAAVQRSLTFN